LNSGRGRLNVLKLALKVLNGLVELSDARLEFVDRVVQRLNLAGCGVDFAAERIVLLVQLLLKGIHGLGHLIGVVSSLLDEVLKDTEFLVEGGLHALHHVEELLNLRLESDDLFRGSVCPDRHEYDDCREDDRSDNRAMAKSECFWHRSPTMECLRWVDAMLIRRAGAIS